MGMEAAHPVELGARLHGGRRVEGRVGAVAGDVGGVPGRRRDGVRPRPARRLERPSCDEDYKRRRWRSRDGVGVLPQDSYRRNPQGTLRRDGLGSGITYFTWRREAGCSLRKGYRHSPPTHTHKTYSHLRENKRHSQNPPLIRLGISRKVSKQGVLTRRHDMYRYL